MSDIQTTAAPDGWKPTGGAGTVPKLVVPTHIDGLSGEENALLRELAEVWTRHASRNRTLTAYYEAIAPGAAVLLRDAVAIFTQDNQD